jgi:hypothetical protein
LVKLFYLQNKKFLNISHYKYKIFRPSTIAWWRGVSFSGEIGIIGTEQGEIIFVNLETGQQVGSTKIDGCVASFFICQDTELDTVTLLITNNCKEQWYLVLEKPGSNYIYPLSDISLHQPKLQNSETDSDESKTFPTTRSRLRGLKQLSVEKLVILKQKLAESRNRNFESSTASLGMLLHILIYFNIILTFSYNFKYFQIIVIMTAIVKLNLMIMKILTRKVYFLINSLNLLKTVLFLSPYPMRLTLLLKEWITGELFTRDTFHL